jgi:hypothetical protein
MLELDPLTLEGALLKTLHPALKEIVILLEPFARNSPASLELSVSHYLQKIRRSLRIITSGDLPGASPLISFINPQSALLLGSPSIGPLLHNKPCAGI